MKIPERDSVISSILGKYMQATHGKRTSIERYVVMRAQGYAVVEFEYPERYPKILSPLAFDDQNAEAAKRGSKSLSLAIAGFRLDRDKIDDFTMRKILELLSDVDICFVDKKICTEGEDYFEQGTQHL